MSNLPPIDTSVVVPPAVTRAAAAAEAIHKAAYQTPNVPEATSTPAPQPAIQPANLPRDPDQPIQIVAVSEPVAPAAQPAAQQPVVPAQVQEPTPPPEPVDNWEHRYLSMKGRYDQSQATIGGMQETMSQLGDEVQRLTGLVNMRGRQEQIQRQQSKKLITPEDEKTFGPEIIDLAKRAATEAIAPELNAVRQENQQLKHQVANQATAGVYEALDAQLPNWREVNTSPRFVSWLSLRDLYSGEVRGKLLRQALNAADAPRVLRFFNGFLAEERATGQLPDPNAPQPAPVPPRVAAVNLVTLTAPGVRPATDTNAPADKPIFTHAQIREFYSHQGRARYVGREQDRKNDEAEIFAAQREGRIR